MVRPKPLQIVEKEGQLVVTGGPQSCRSTFGTANPLVSAWLLHDIDVTLPNTLLGLTADRNCALAALNDMGPRDVVEAMINTQMLLAHNQSVVFLKKASVPGLPDHVVDANINRATKFTRTLSALTETLIRYRSRCAQAVIVEEVHVHDGEKAIVGAITPAPSANTPEDDREETA